MSIEELPDWRAILKQAILSPHERDRIARFVGVDPNTLMRWIKQKTTPRRDLLRRLPAALPHVEAQMRASIEAMWAQENVISPIQPDIAGMPAQQIPHDFYIRVLHTQASLAPALLFPTLTDLILEEALKQFDPERVGVTVTLSRCLPAITPKQPVRTLLANVGRGTPPWKADLEGEAWLLGVESLSGSAVMKGHLEYNQELSDPMSLAPGYAAPGEQSAAAAPILHTGRIAGCLCVASTQPRYFTPSRLALVEAYADLLALAFEPHEFYAPQHIQLGIVPQIQEQLRLLLTFRQRVRELMQRVGQQQSLTSAQAQLLIWQQLEAEMLDVDVTNAFSS